MNLTFVMDEGPQVKIRDVDFTGNKAVGDGKLKKQMKNNKGKGFSSFITGAGTYQEDKFEEDADKVTAYYRDHGYISARVGEPELRYVEDSADRKTRWVTLRIPVTEGERYRVGELRSRATRSSSPRRCGGCSRCSQAIGTARRSSGRGYEKAREVYGAGGYYEFNLVPMTRPSIRTRPRPRRSPARPPADGAAKPAEATQEPPAKADPPAEATARQAAAPPRSRRPASRCPRARPSWTS